MHSLKICFVFWVYLNITVEKEITKSLWNELAYNSMINMLYQLQSCSYKLKWHDFHSICKITISKFILKAECMHPLI